MWKSKKTEKKKKVLSLCKSIIAMRLRKKYKRERETNII